MKDLIVQAQELANDYSNEKADALLIAYYEAQAQAATEALIAPTNINVATSNGTP